MMALNLKSLSNSELLDGVRQLRIDERKLDRKIVEYIGEIESRRLYAELGYPSVLEWLIKDLGYSESSAYRRTMAARAIRSIPQAAEKIEDGRLNLVALAKVQSAIRCEEKRTGERVSLELRSMMIAKTENKTLRETERIVATQFPDSVKSPGIQIVLTDEQLKDLERVRELKSHSNFGASLSEIIGILAKQYLERNDPLRREVKPRSTHLEKKPENFARQTIESTQSSTTVKVDRAANRARRKANAPSIQNLVRRRAGDACEFKSESGHRCGTRFQTQVDHVLPVALGGTNDVRNLRLLCRVHNVLMAEKFLGSDTIRPFLRP